MDCGMLQRGKKKKNADVLWSRESNKETPPAIFLPIQSSFRKDKLNP